jgi:hypothetical protein
MSSSQLRPLIGLRWRMVRSRKARIGFAVLVCAVPVLCLTAVVTGLLAPRERSFDITLLAPTAYLSVALLAVLAPLVSGGGNDLFPPEQLSAFPVTARTQYAASVALTPLNLAWTTQLVALLGLTAYAAGPTLLVPVALLTCLAYIAFVTLAGQALAWGVVGVRQRAGGRRASWAAALLIVGAALLVLVTGNVG